MQVVNRPSHLLFHLPQEFLDNGQLLDRSLRIRREALPGGLALKEGARHQLYQAVMHIVGDPASFLFLDADDHG